MYIASPLVLDYINLGPSVALFNSSFERVVTRIDTPKSDCHLHSKYMIGVL